MTTTQTQYDSLDRPVSVTYSDGTPNKTYNYDVAQAGGANVLGRLAYQFTQASSAGPAAQTYSYDPLGRVAQVNTCSPSTCGKFTTAQNYTYDYAGNTIQATDGGGATIAYGYTPANEIASATSPQSAVYPFNLMTNVVNGPFGPVSYQLGNGLNNVSQYDSLGRRTGGWICSGSTSPLCTGGTQLYGFTITPNGGRVNQACDTVLNNCSTMAYDDLNRLKSRTTTSDTTLNDSWTYDRYGNRWSQTANPGGYQGNLSFNQATNQAIGFSYDAAGNLLNDSQHSYTYDADGNMTAVDAGQTAKYAYDASNNRVRGEFFGGVYEELFDLDDHKTVIFDANSGSVLEENTRFEDLPLAAYQGGTLYFEHQDWLGTERLLTDSQGTTAGSYSSMPFGDTFTENGTDLDPYHFAGLEHDYESGLDHAKYREYSSAGGQWMSPDLYQGSYDFADPQSFDRYSYVGNNPLSLVDPTGQDGEGGGGSTVIPIAGVGNLITDILNALFYHPTFHGSLAPRPNAQPWDEYNIQYGPNIAGALGLPDGTCDFGPCVGGPMTDEFQQGLPAGGGPILFNPPPWLFELFNPNSSNSNRQKQLSCARKTLRKNAISLGLDAVGFIPGEGIAATLGQIGVGTASTINSASSGDSGGAFANIAGLQLAALAPAARIAGLGVAKSIPLLGTALNVVSTGRDVYSAYGDYQGCLARR